MGTYTTNKNLFMPTVGETGWGTLVNGNFETIDTLLKPITVSGSTYTFTGNHVGNQSGGTITATKITNSGTLTQTGTSTFTGKLTANGGIGTKALSATSISNSGNMTNTGTLTSTGKIYANGGIEIKGVVSGDVTFNGNITAANFNGIPMGYTVYITKSSGSTIGIPFVHSSSQRPYVINIGLYGEKTFDWTGFLNNTSADGTKAIREVINLTSDTLTFLMNVLGGLTVTCGPYTYDNSGSTSASSYELTIDEVNYLLTHESTITGTTTHLGEKQIYVLVPSGYTAYYI